jgi:general secretion pathway protein D
MYGLKPAPFTLKPVPFTPLIPAEEMSYAVPAGLRSSRVESASPTLKRGANERCASGAAARKRTEKRVKSRLGSVRTWTALLLLFAFPRATMAQTAMPPQQPAGQSAAQGPAAPSAVNNAPQPGQPPENGQSTKETTGKKPTSAERRKAAKLYMDASKLFVNGQFEAAMAGYQRAAELDPSNNDYRLSVDVARSHAVTALIQSAAKARLLGDEGSARADLTSALELDPRNIEATQHLDELGDEALRGQTKPLYGQTGGGLGDSIALEPSAGVHSFHVRADRRSAIQQVFKAYGITAMVDDSVPSSVVRLDVDDAGFDEAMRVLSLVTGTFYVPLDAHRSLVAKDSRELRERFTREELETVYLPGLSTTGQNGNDLTEIGNVAKNVFSVQQVSTDAGASTITLRGTPRTLAAFNSTMRVLLDGRNQVLLDVRMIQVAHTLTRNTGAQLPQSVTGFNVYAEEQTLLNQNASLVQQIISSGLAAPGDTLAILAILLASGQVSSSIFSNGLALFGGGLTASGVSLGSMTFNLDLNTSDSRELDDIQLRLGDNEAGTIKEGERYPIQTASYSSLSPNLPNIPGLTGAGSSSSLTSLLGSLSSSVPNIPMVQYQDLGLTLKATPKVMRNDTVAVTVDMKLDSLSGSSVDGNPILNSQSYSGVATLKEGEAAVLAANLSKSQSMDISGTPGLSEIPGLNNITDKNLQSNYATLIIVITPHLVRGTQSAGHTPMMMVDKAATQ